VEDTLENAKHPKNSASMKPRMKHGEEPTEVLLALVSSPLMTLRDRGLARIMVANSQDGPVVLAIFGNAAWSEAGGMTIANTSANTLPQLPTLPNGNSESVGKPE